MAAARLLPPHLDQQLVEPGRPRAACRCGGQSKIIGVPYMSFRQTFDRSMLHIRVLGLVLALAVSGALTLPAFAQNASSALVEGFSRPSSGPTKKPFAPPSRRISA